MTGKPNLVSTVKDISCNSYSLQFLHFVVSLGQSGGQLPVFVLKASPLWDFIHFEVVSQFFQQSKAAMQCSEGVNDLWSAPAADVGGMEVNRDEFLGFLSVDLSSLSLHDRPL